MGWRGLGDNGSGTPGGHVFPFAPLFRRGVQFRGSRGFFRLFFGPFIVMFTVRCDGYARDGRHGCTWLYRSYFGTIEVVSVRQFNKYNVQNYKLRIHYQDQRRTFVFEVAFHTYQFFYVQEALHFIDGEVFYQLYCYHVKFNALYVAGSWAGLPYFNAIYSMPEITIPCGNGVCPSSFTYFGGSIVEIGWGTRVVGEGAIGVWV